MKVQNSNIANSQMSKLSKSKTLKSKVDESLDLRYSGDIRALIVAHIFVSRMENNDIEQSLHGQFRTFHQRTGNLRTLLWAILITLFFTHKPEWCLLKPDIEKDCLKDYSGVEYHLMLTFYINSAADAMISLMIMGMFMCYQYFRYENVPQFKMERTKLMLMGFVFSLAFVLRIAVLSGLILPTAFENSIKVVFVLASSSMVIRTCIRFGKLVKYTLTIIAFLLITVFWFSLYFRIRFNGVEFGDDDAPINYTISLVSFARTYQTMISTIFGDTFPDMPLELFDQCLFSFFVFWFFVILNNIVLMSLIGGIFFFVYNEILVLNYEDVCKKYVGFEDQIQFIMNQTFSSYEGVNKVVQYYLQKNNKKKQKTWLIKFKRAIKKLQIVQIISKVEDEVENYYNKLRRTFLFMCIDLTFSFYAMIIPVIVESMSTPREMADYIFFTEIFALIFLVDQYLTYKLEKKENVFTFHYIVELISNITMMITIHLILIEKVNLEDQNVYNQSQFFVLWKIACLLKVFRINEILMTFIGYTIIIRTITDVYPLIQDLLTLFIIVVLFAGTIFMSIFGGKMNDEYLHYHQRITGNKYEGSVNLNYNDIVSSMIKISSMTFLGFAHILEDSRVLGYLIRRNRNDVTIFSLFTIFVYLMMELFIMNVLIGIILSLTSVYISNTEQIEQKESLMTDENDLLNWIIDEIKDETSLEKKERLKKQKKKQSRIMKEMKEIIKMDYDQLVERQQQRKQQLRDLMQKNKGKVDESIISDNIQLNQLNLSCNFSNFKSSSNLFKTQHISDQQDGRCKKLSRFLIFFNL